MAKGWRLTFTTEYGARSFAVEEPEWEAALAKAIIARAEDIRNPRALRPTRIDIEEIDEIIRKDKTAT